MTVVICYQLRRVTWWTRDVKEFPDVSDDETEVDMKSNEEKSSDYDGSSKDGYEGRGKSQEPASSLILSYS